MARRIALITGLVLALVIISLLCLGRHRGSMELDIAKRTHDSLIAAGHDGIEVSAEAGRDIVLRGVVADDDQKLRVAELASQAVGVRRVENLLEFRPPVTLEGLSIQAVKGEITLAGVVPDDMTRQELLALAERRFPTMTVIDALDIDDGAEADRAHEGALLIENFDLGMAPGRLHLEADDLTVTGQVGSEQRKAARGRELAELFPGSRVINRLEVAVQPAIAEVLALRRIEFASGSSRLTAVGRRTLDEVASVLAEWPDLDVEISGHTDSTGDPGFNLRLSRERAEAVRAYLAPTVPAVRFTVVGFGAERPIASDDTAEGRLKNRRIEFRVIGENDQ